MLCFMEVITCNCLIKRYAMKTYGGVDVEPHHSWRLLRSRNAVTVNFSLKNADFECLFLGRYLNYALHSGTYHLTFAPSTDFI
jgi:hypothetical protein